MTLDEITDGYLKPIISSICRYEAAHTYLRGGHLKPYDFYYV